MKWGLFWGLVLLAMPTFAAGRAVTLSTSDGTMLAAVLYEPSARSAPGIVLVHMLGRSKEDWDGIASRLADAGALVLAIDLRGHGRSSGSMATLTPMVEDVRGAVLWVAARPGVRADAIAVVGASLGANLALLAAADNPLIRAVAAVSPSLEYRGLRLDPATQKKLGDRPLWLGVSLHDPYALRTVKNLVEGAGNREQRFSDATAHGTNLLSADPDLSRALVDWLRRALIF